MTLHDLHTSGLFLMPDAWDAGSARMLADLGFPAIATTSPVTRPPWADPTGR